MTVVAGPPASSSHPPTPSVTPVASPPQLLVLTGATKTLNKEGERTGAIYSGTLPSQLAEWSHRRRRRHQGGPRLSFCIPIVPRPLTGKKGSPA